MEKWSDVWKYLCGSTDPKRISDYYVCSGTFPSRCFWDGVLTALEASGVISKENADRVWKEIENAR